MEKPIYIFGHKNPDVDAICAPIAYAHLKKAMGFDNFIPARCGNSNSRIDTMLKHFDIPLPTFISDVTPTVADIMKEKIHTVNVESTCNEALEIIDKYDIRALPVVNDDKEVKGIISIFQLGEFFIPKPKETKNMRHVYSSINSIVEAVQGKFIISFDEEIIDDFYVRIGAMAIDSFGSFSRTENIAAQKSIIVVGDRIDIQKKSIDLGVRALVVTGGLKVSEEITEYAKSKKVSIISSPHDSATTSWLARTATKLTTLVDTHTVQLAADEKLIHVTHKLQSENAPIYLVIDEENKLKGLFTKTDLLKPVENKIVLLDHNELSQAVPGAEHVKIAEIIDHHRLGNPPSEQPILFKNIPWGSTCTIIADMYQQEKIDPTPAMAGLMMSGIITDTLNLQSPTTALRDREILPWLENFADISIEDLAQLLFSSGSLILTCTPDQVVDTDCKTYKQGDLSYSVAQIEELGFDNFWEHSQELHNALKKYRKKHQLYFSSLLVTDINTQNSLLVIDGETEVIDQILYPEVQTRSIFEFKNIVSRKKQLIPYFTTLLKTINV